MYYFLNKSGMVAFTLFNAAVHGVTKSRTRLLVGHRHLVTEEQHKYSVEISQSSSEWEGYCLLL